MHPFASFLTTQKHLETKKACTKSTTNSLNKGNCLETQIQKHHPETNESRGTNSLTQEIVDISSRFKRLDSSKASRAAWLGDLVRMISDTREALLLLEGSCCWCFWIFSGEKTTCWEKMETLWNMGYSQYQRVQEFLPTTYHRYSLTT